MLDNRVMHMTPEENLPRGPGRRLHPAARHRHRDQLRLDQMAVRVAAMLGNARVEFRGAQGKTSEQSLLGLGFTPTFYHFSETELEVRMTISIKVEESFKFGLSASVGNDAGSIAQASNNAAAGAAAAGAGGNANANAAPQAAPAGGDRRAVAFGAAINVEYHRKYGFEMSGSSMVRTKMIAVPAPEALRE